MHAPYVQSNQQHIPHMLKFNIPRNLMKNIAIFISDTEPRSLYRGKAHNNNNKKRERERERKA